MSTHRVATLADYSRIYKEYEEDYAASYRNFTLIDAMIALLYSRKMNRLPIIDLGSGTGTVVDHMIDKNLTHITAVEFSNEYCAIMSSKYHRFVHINVVNEEIVHFMKHIKKDSVGAVTAHYVLFRVHDEEIDILFESIYQSLKPGGLFYASCFKGIQKSNYAVSEHKDTKIEVDKDLPYYMNYFTEIELEGRLHKAGFKMIEMSTAHELSERSGYVDIIRFLVERP